MCLSVLPFFPLSLPLRLGALDSAIEAYSEALCLDPGFLEGYVGRGNVYMDYLTDEGNTRSRCLMFRTVYHGREGGNRLRKEGGRD